MRFPILFYEVESLIAQVFNSELPGEFLDCNSSISIYLREIHGTAKIWRQVNQSFINCIWIWSL